MEISGLSYSFQTGQGPQRELQKCKDGGSDVMKLDENFVY